MCDVRGNWMGQWLLRIKWLRRSAVAVRNKSTLDAFVVVVVTVVSGVS